MSKDIISPNINFSNMNKKPKLAREESGLTLVEVIAVIILIGLVGGVLFKGIFGQTEAAKAQINVTRMEKVKLALKNYKLQFNKYPTSLSGLIKASGDIPQGKLFTPFADEDDLLDVWGTPYKYKVQGRGRAFTLTTLGADGAPGGEGGDQDITVK